MKDVLIAESIVKSYQFKPVLTDIYLRCLSGEIIGLLGTNGCGKSTLLKIIFGELKADHKYICINEQVLEKPYLKRDLINYLPQEGFLPLNLTVKKAVNLYNYKKDFFLDDPILKNNSELLISKLSGGEIRYLEIKLLLASNAKFVLLDEPFNGASPIMTEIIKQMILKESLNKGIILTDHDYRNVFDVANKYYLMFDGGLKKIKNLNELIDWGYIPDSKQF